MSARKSPPPRCAKIFGIAVHPIPESSRMDDQNVTGGAAGTPNTQAETSAPSQQQAAPYVRQRPAHRSVGTVNGLDDGEETPARIAHDSGYTNRGSIMSGGSYRRSRSDADKLRRDLQYGQYLEIPKGRRDIIASREKNTRIKTAIALLALIVVLVLVVFFLWNFMTSNRGSVTG